MKIAVIGGGAGGIAAAIYAKRNNMKNSVTVFERGDRILKKLLATGNGRCNLSNESISPENYFSHTPDSLEQILSAFPENEERQFYALKAAEYIPIHAGQMRLAMPSGLNVKDSE